MAHYDCNHCGNSMGIGYGFCDRCTPNWVFEARERYTKIRFEVQKEVDENFKEMTEDLESRKADNFEALIKKHKDLYDLEYDAGKDWYKNYLETHVD